MGKKTEVISIRCTKKDKRMIKKAAGKEGVGDFLINAVKLQKQGMDYQEVIKKNVEMAEQLNRLHRLCLEIPDVKEREKFLNVFKGRR